MIRDVLAGAKGTMLARAIFALLSPIVTRLDSTHELGIYGLVMAFAGVAVSVAGVCRHEHEPRLTLQPQLSKI